MSKTDSALRAAEEVLRWLNLTDRAAVEPVATIIRKHSLIDSKAAEGKSDDGGAEWCDDCHGYTHKYECPSKRQHAKTPIVDQAVNAVYRSMAQYEDGTWWLDELKAKARVGRLIATIPSAMRDKCVEKVRELAGKFERESFAEAGNQRLIDKTRVDTALAIAAALESLTLEEKQQS